MRWSLPYPGRWSALAALGESRVLRSSYFWFFAVPIAAKIVRSMKRGGDDLVALLLHQFHVSLPYSWRTLFYASVCFAAASAIYQFYCPRLVRDFTSAAAFLDTGRRLPQLVEMCGGLLSRHSISEPARRSNLYSTVSTLRESLSPGSGNVELRFDSVLECRRSIREALAVDTTKERLSVGFWLVRDWADTLRPRWRLVCFYFYVFGFVFLGEVILRNIWAVLAISGSELGIRWPLDPA